MKTTKRKKRLSTGQQYVRDFNEVCRPVQKSLLTALKKVSTAHVLEKGGEAKADLSRMAHEVIKDVAVELVIRLVHGDRGRLYRSLHNKLRTMLPKEKAPAAVS